MCINVVDAPALEGTGSLGDEHEDRFYDRTVRSQLTLVLISSLPGTAGLPLFICFSTSYPELDFAVPRNCRGGAYDKSPVRGV
jgi:hypothetical protein